MLKLFTESEKKAGWSDLQSGRIGIMSLSLYRYRCFQEIEISLSPDLTLITAPNGQGKTAILDAIAISLKYFVDTLQNKTSSPGFAKTDIQLYVSAYGTMENYLAEGPTKLIAAGFFSGKWITWARDLKSDKPNTKTSIAHAKELGQAAKDLLASMQISNHQASGSESKVTTLPLITYYGTGRLFDIKKDTKRNNTLKNSRLSGYQDCLDSKSSYKQFLAWYAAMSREAVVEETSGLDAGHLARQRLEAVNIAIRNVLEPTAWRGIRWDFNNQELLAFTDDGSKLPVRLLSDGVRNMLAMTADMAFRCSQMNPHLKSEAASQTPGIVLIDEIEMHLHPEWQQVVIKKFMTTFPMIQFVMTTHSPQIATTVRRECIRVLNEGTIITPAQSPYGQEAGGVLPTIFRVSQRPPIPEIEEKLGEYYECLRKGASAEEEAQKIQANLAEIGYEFNESESYRARLLSRYFSKSSDDKGDING
jgi:predicted ATP-binding protein involved in virulence